MAYFLHSGHFGANPNLDQNPSFEIFENTFSPQNGQRNIKSHSLKQITDNPLISIIIRRRETESIQLHADNASVFRKISFIQNMYLAATPFIVSFAVMTAVPAPLAVTFPFWSTVATLVSLELHAKFRFLLSAGVITGCVIIPLVNFSGYYYNS